MARVKRVVGKYPGLSGHATFRRPALSVTSLRLGNRRSTDRASAVYRLLTADDPDFICFNDSVVFGLKSVAPSQDLGPGAMRPAAREIELRSVSFAGADLLQGVLT